MNTQSFSFNAMLKTGWSVFKNHWKFILGAGALTIALYLVMNILQTRLDTIPVISTVFSFFTVLVGIILTLGWAKVLLSLIRNHDTRWETFKTKPRIWLQYVKTYLWYILYALVCAIGTALPGAIIAAIGFFTDIYWLLAVGVVLASAGFVLVFVYYMIRYQFINFAVLDYPELSSREVFKKAGLITKKHILQLLGFGIIVGLLNLLGVIPLGLGLIITIPVTKLAQTKIYTYLKEQQN